MRRIFSIALVFGFIAPTAGCFVTTRPRNCPPGTGMKDGECQDLNGRKQRPAQCPKGTWMKDGRCVSKAGH